MLKSTSSLRSSTPILYTKQNPKPNRFPKYMIKPLHIWHPPFWLILDGSLCEDLGFFHRFKNEPKIIKIGVRMKKLCMFYFRYAGCFLRGRKFREVRKFRGPEVPGKFRGKFRVNQRVCTYVFNRGPGSSGLAQKFRAAFLCA